MSQGIDDFVNKFWKMVKKCGLKYSDFTKNISITDNISLDFEAVSEKYKLQFMTCLDHKDLSSVVEEPHSVLDCIWISQDLILEDNQMGYIFLHIPYLSEPVCKITSNFKYKKRKFVYKIRELWSNEKYVSAVYVLIKEFARDKKRSEKKQWVVQGELIF